MNDFYESETGRLGNEKQSGQVEPGFSSNEIAYQLACITEQVSDSIITTDLDFKITYVNSAFQKMYGYSCGEVLGLTPGILNADAESEEIQNEIYQTVSAGEVWKCEIVNVRKDGSTFPCELTIFPLKDENGNTFAYTGIQRDITERKMAEDMLRQKEDTIRALVETSQDWIWEIDDKGIHTYCNPAFEKILGYRVEDMVGHSALEFIHEEDRKTVEENLSHCIVNKIGWNNKVIRWRHKDGDYRYLESNAVPIFDSQKNLLGFRGIDRDITDRKNAEVALKRHSLRSDILLELNKMRDASREDIMNFVREEAIKITQSEFSFLGFLSDDESTMKIESWSRGVMAKCAVFDKPIHFPISKAGLWAEAVRQRKPVIINDSPGPHAAMKGFPAGHVPIKRFMCIPVFEGDRIVMVAAVANKEKVYDESDISALTSMMDDAWGLFRQKQSEEAIVNLSRFPSENSSPVLRVADDGRLLYSNNASQFLLDLWNCQTGQFVPDDWRKIVDQALEDLSDTRIETKYSDQVFSFQFIPVAEAGYVNVYGRNITERIRAEESIRNSEERYRSLTEATTSIIWTTDATGGYVDPQPSWEKFTGQPWSEHKDSGWTKMIHPEDIGRISKAWEKSCRAIEVYETYGRVWNANLEQWRNFEVTAVPIMNLDGSLREWVGVMTDITERKRIKEQLEVSKEHAEAASVAKSDFLANMSHEIRTPMSVIAGLSDMLASEELSKQQMAYVDLIRNAGKSLLVIINDILDYSKIEAGKLEVYLSEHSLKEIVDEVASIMRPLADGKGLEFGVIYSERLPEMIETDWVRINECLVNLVSNAIKFTDDGFVYVKVSMEDRDGEFFIRFDVKDSGIGIPEEYQEHIFDSFSQVEKGSTRDFGGTGLGLSITSQLAGLLGGSVSVSSEEGKGSTFTLVIPAGACTGIDRHAAKKKSGRKIIEVKSARKVPVFSANVLVAEDHEGCRLIVRKMLELYGLNVTTANDGKEAVDEVLKGKYDLVFMDVRMPEYNGFEATGILRQKGVDVPIIALTAHAMEGDRQMCIEAGYSDYLSKPIDRDKLLEILGCYLESAEKTV